MLLVRTKRETRERLGRAREAGQTVGFVPTLGCLHDGHVSLMRRAREENDLVVISIFVNPLQFEPRRYEEYPRDLERDSRIADEAGVDLVLAPDREEMYPPDLDVVAFTIASPSLMTKMDGRNHVWHFEGVAVVVAKLFCIVRPDRAYFGEKDPQQLAIIKRMVEYLDLGVEIVSVPTLREPDGLPFSSRNYQLTAEERAQAAGIPRAMALARELLLGGTAPDAVKDRIRSSLKSLERVRVDFLDIVDARTLEPVPSFEAPVLVHLAVFVGERRLTDSFVLAPKRHA